MKQCKCKPCAECKRQSERSSQHYKYTHERMRILEILSRYQRLLNEQDSIFPKDHDGCTSVCGDADIIIHIRHIINYYESMLKSHCLYDTVPWEQIIDTPIKKFKKESEIKK